jgi:hypothetical protein
MEDPHVSENESAQAQAHKLKSRGQFQGYQRQGPVGRRAVRASYEAGFRPNTLGALEGPKIGLCELRPRRAKRRQDQAVRMRARHLGEDRKAGETFGKAKRPDDWFGFSIR